MANELQGDSATKLLEVKVSGKLSKENYEELEPLVDELIDEGFELLEACLEEHLS